MVAFAPTTTLIGFCSRDPVGYVDGNHFFAFLSCMPLVLLDPTGTQKKLPFDEVWNRWKKKHPHLNRDELDRCDKQLAMGCIGITLINTGAADDTPDLSHCYNERIKARVCGRWNLDCPLGEIPAGFSIHLWNNGNTLPTNGNGTVDLTIWWNNGNPRPRPAGDWGDGVWHEGGINYDFGFVVPGDGKNFSEMLHNENYDFGGNDMLYHADQFHNPDRDGDGIGDYYVDLWIRDATLYASTPGEWENYPRDFDTEVWCVTCRSKNSIAR